MWKDVVILADTQNKLQNSQPTATLHKCFKSVCLVSYLHTIYELLCLLSNEWHMEGWLESTLFQNSVLEFPVGINENHENLIPKWESDMLVCKQT
jgi:hypothetical protein